jgi:hypothetical protein
MRMTHSLFCDVQSIASFFIIGADQLSNVSVHLSWRFKAVADNGSYSASPFVFILLDLFHFPRNR